MKIICCNDYKEMSRVGADLVADVIKNKPDCVLGLATGSTPEGLYAELISMYQKGELDFSAVTTVNLDEYYPISPENEQSYRYFMNTKLFDHVNVNKANTYVPDGSAADAAAEAARYEAFVRGLGGADIQVLGIGRNGHIAFNEPAEALHPATHVTSLTADTVEANARFFESIDQVPTLALTMGMGTILSAKKIIILANGKGKHEAIKAMLQGTVSTSCPASFLNLHADVTLICDHDAYEG
ncbi:MAG: glucosamine-6-phosphate deaminase [Ruminococcaceae bacterium]|nr:glucosamine-6-phosphate deaminase [Oscillospiraceae bacterium]